MPSLIYNDEPGSSNSNARLLLNLFSEALLVFDANTQRLVDFNKAALSLFHCRSRDAFLKHIHQLLTDDDSLLYKSLIKAFEYVPNEKESLIETSLPKANGSVFHASIKFKTFDSTKSGFVGMLIADISGRKTADELKIYQLKLEKLTYEISARFISSASHDANKHIAKSLEKIVKTIEADIAFIALFRESMQVLEISHLWHRSAKISESKKNWFIELDPGQSLRHQICERKTVHCNTLDNMSPKDSQLYQFYATRQMNSFLNIGLVYQEKCIGFFGLGTTNESRIWTDDEQRMLQIISEILVSAIQHKEAVRYLLEGERTYREIYNASTDAMLVVDYETGYLIDVNKSFTELFGYDYTEYAHIKFSSLWDIGDKKSLNPDEVLVKSEKKRQLFKAKAIKKDRSFFWADTAVQFAELHGIRRALVVVRDVTEFIQTEELLTHSKDWFQSIVQQLTDVVVVVEPHASIKYVTPSVTKTLGYQVDEFEKLSVYNLLSEAEKTKFSEFIQAIQQVKNLPSIELQMRCFDGKWLAMEVVARNLLENAAVRGIVLTFKDISERKGFEQKMLETVIKTEEQERERFAKNLHDDLGPLLSSLKMYIGMLGQLQSAEKKDFVIHQLIEIIKEAIITTKHVSNDLSPHVLNNYGLGAALKSFISKLPSANKIVLDDLLNDSRYAPSLEISVYRIAKELINNSIKHSQAKQMIIRVMEEDKNLSLYFSDDGVGIEICDLEKYMEKGMGLSNIISRAKTLNSTYKLNSIKDKGFTFEMTVPIS